MTTPPRPSRYDEPLFGGDDVALPAQALPSGWASPVAPRHLASALPAGGIEAQVCADIAKRQLAGLARAGTFTSRPPTEQLYAAYHQVLDLAIHLRRAIADAERAGGGKP